MYKLWNDYHSKASSIKSYKKIFFPCDENLQDALSQQPSNMYYNIDYGHQAAYYIPRTYSFHHRTSVSPHSLHSLHQPPPSSLLATNTVLSEFWFVLFFDFTHKWSHMAFVFLCLTLLSLIFLGCSHAVANG